MLFDSVSMSGGVYIGREADILKFNNDLIQCKDKVPNVFAITGLNGIGRRTFIKDIFEKRFALPFIAQFELSGTEGLIELYRKLLDENIENLSSERINELYSWFYQHLHRTKAQKYVESWRYTPVIEHVLLL